MKRAGATIKRLKGGQERQGLAHRLTAGSKQHATFVGWCLSQAEPSGESVFMPPLERENELTSSAIQCGAMAFEAAADAVRWVPADWG